MSYHLPRTLFRLAGTLFLLLTLFATADSFAFKPEQLSEKGTLFLQVSTGPSLGYRIKVNGLRQQETFLVDMGSFARALRLRSTFDGEQMKIDESFSKQGSSCLLRTGNSFLLIMPREGDSGQRVVQLQAAPEVWQGTLYLPVDQVCRMYSQWLGREVAYEPAGSVIKARLWGKGPRPSVRLVGAVARSEGAGVQAEPSANEPSSVGRTVVRDISVQTLANGFVARFAASGKKNAISFLKPDDKGTAYITIEHATGDIPRLTKRFSNGMVRSITPMPLDSGALQFAVVLNTDGLEIKSSDIQYDPKKNSYVLCVMSNVNVEAIRRAEKEQQDQQVSQLQQDPGSALNKWKLDAIVVDAGHGGKDPGAIGTRGTKEKDVVLNIASDLGMFIRQKWPDVKVIYTRKEDLFVPLNERGRLANRHGGKLFVSVHCNAAPKNDIRGTEVYILGPHKSDQALGVALLENSAITREENYQESYKGFSDEYLIVNSMTQNAFAMQSTELAQNVLRKIERKQSNNGLGVRQAGFMVLWTPSMPSILVETGYISNPDEEKILRNRAEQTKIAYGIFQGLQIYKANYENRMLASGGNG